MAQKQIITGDVLLYFASQSSSNCDPQLKNLETIKLWNGFKPHVEESRKQELADLIKVMVERPTYVDSKVVGKEFGCGGIFSSVTFTMNLMLLVEQDALINPFGRVFGLSPQFLMKLGVLDQFLGRARSCTADEVWAWVRGRISQLTDFHKQLRQLRERS
jgi:hypothetical protein